jgi:hypothetical protein
MTNHTDTAAAHLAKAAQHDQDAADSFERCDTDGFLSQWGSQQMGALERRQADIAAAGGVWTFSRLQLVTAAGEATDARLVETRYGAKWRLDSTDQWLPVQPKRESTLAKHGYREVTETEVAPAKAIHWAPAGARGLSGATSVQVIIFRTDRPKHEGWRPAGAPQA